MFNKLIIRIFHVWMLTAILMLSGTALNAAEQPITVKYAKGFTVETLGDCRLLTVRPAWRKGSPGFRYLLVPKGKNAPENHPDAQIVKVPVKRVVALSSTYLAYMDAAGMADRLVGLSNFKYVNSPSVRKRIGAGELTEVGHSSGLKIEILMDLSPDIILTSASGSIHDVHPKLMEAGLTTVLVPEHLEAHPLGRCEWMKCLALFFGTYSHADALFNEIEARYNALVQKTAAMTQKHPTVMINVPFQGQWWIPKGGSFVAQYIRDAGGEYLWSDIPGVGSSPLDVEAVYDKALSADFWLNTGMWRRLEDASAADMRFEDIRAMKQKRLYNNNKRMNQWGGNDYWESGMLNPDAVLADLISILHPGLLPDHELVYYQRLTSGEKQ